MDTALVKIDGRWVHTACSTPERTARTFPFGYHKGAGQYCKYCMSTFDADGKGPISTSRINNRSHYESENSITK